MSVRKPLLDGDISLSEALDSQQTMITNLGFPEQQQQFYDHLARNLKSIVLITCQLLGISSKHCFISTHPDEWIRGTFNVCIPIEVKVPDTENRYYLFRVPLPHKLGEKFAPGNVDEKIRSEAGTYAWIKENCPEIPIPCLRGFGLTNDQKTIRRKKSLFKLASSKPVIANKQSSYRLVSDPVEHALGTGFLLLDNIEGRNSNMLSETWQEQHTDKTKRTRFFSHLARIMLALAQIPHKKIAAPCFNDNCTVTFTNRPMTPYLAQMENEKVPIPIQRNDTFNHCSAYVSDLLRCQDNFLYHGRNSVSDEEDAQFQTAVLTAMRAIQPSFFPDSSLRGPFHMAFTDLHSSNIFVDSDWRITNVIDLEWMGTRPLEMISPPDWMCDSNDDIAASTELRVLQEEFVSILQREEDRLRLERPKTENPSMNPLPLPRLGEVMRKGLANGAPWYCLALNSYTFTTFIWSDALKDLYFTHLPKKSDEKSNSKGQQPGQHQPNSQVVVPIRTADKATGGTIELGNGHCTSPSSVDSYQEDEEDTLIYSIASCSRLWRQGYSEFVNKKLDDRARYIGDLRKVFEKPDQV